MKRLIKSAAIAICAISLSACMSAGSGSINWDSARKVKSGMTYKEVAGLMGQPYKVVGKPNNEQTWVWVHVATFSGAESATVTFKDGKVMEPIPVPENFK